MKNVKSSLTSHHMSCAQTSTTVKEYDVTKHNLTRDDFSLAVAVLGYDALTSGRIGVQSTNVSFGLTKDKFYAVSNYTQW